MEVKRTTITLPEKFYKQIVAIADREERSFNKQVITLLKKAIENYKTEKGGEKK